MVGFVALGLTWYVATSFSNPISRTALEREHNARVMAEVKMALVGWMANKASDTTENNPGRLPCPESLADVGGASEGQAPLSTCALPAIGRVPWKTLGIPKPLDASGEVLWYVVGSGWAASGGMLNINSATVGNLTVDGTANAAIALIVAPGRPLAVQASGNCTARTQRRSASPPDPRDYLECQNATVPADATFATSGPSGSFNDQVLPVTTADVLPQLEAVIVKRVENEIIPALRCVYSGRTSCASSSLWGLNSGANETLFPYAAPFTNPNTSSYLGVAGTTQGLLPMNYSNCTVSAGNPRCTSPVSWSGSPSVSKTGGLGSFYIAPTCTAYTGSTPNYVYCTGYYVNTITISVADTAGSFATGMRMFNISEHTATYRTYDFLLGGYSAWQSATTARGGIASSGSVSFTATATLPTPGLLGWPYNLNLGYFEIYVYRPTISDHYLVTSTDSTYGWFVRNDWHKFFYYAYAPAHSASGASPRNCSGSACLTITNLGGTTNRAVLIFAGRPLAALGQSRTGAGAGSLDQYLDNVENRNLDSTFIKSGVNSTSNDRLSLVDSN